MSKPLGMTPTFQVITPTEVEDAVFNAVEKAIEHGMTPKDFIKEARECWRIKLDEIRKQVADEFSQALK